MFYRRGNRATALMALDNEKGHVEMRHCVLQTADAGGVQHQTGGAHHEEISQALIKDDLRGHPGIGAAKYRGFRLLA
jgi:hypothetical protein